MPKIEQINKFSLVYLSDKGDKQIIKWADLPTKGPWEMDREFGIYLLVDKNNYRKVYSDSLGISGFGACLQFRIDNKYLFVDVSTFSGWENEDPSERKRPHWSSNVRYIDVELSLCDANLKLIERRELSFNYREAYWAGRLGGHEPTWWFSTDEYVRRIFIENDRLIIPQPADRPLTVTIYDRQIANFKPRWDGIKLRPFLREYSHFKVGKAEHKWAQELPRKVADIVYTELVFMKDGTYTVRNKDGKMGVNS